MFCSDNSLVIRLPSAKDGSSVWRLIADCPPLDKNSIYCNLLQCHHFAATSAIAEREQQPAGFISAYPIPSRNNTLFIWQVAVKESARGQGLASQMLAHILSRPQCRKVTHLETTITASNRASWALFKGIAAKWKTELKQSTLFDKQKHFDGAHDSEILVRIGPFSLTTHYQE